MARYRKVDPRLWDDERFVGWDDAKRNLWLLLITGPGVQVVPGLQVGGPASLAETLRRDIGTVSKRFAELCSDGRVSFDERFRVMRIPHAVGYNEPENPNQVKGWFAAWESMPESALKYDHLTTLQAACEKADREHKTPAKSKKKAKAFESSTPFMDAFIERFGTALANGCPNGSSNGSETVRGSRAREEQEQEQELEQEQEESFAPAVAGAQVPGLELTPDRPKPRKPKAPKPEPVETPAHKAVVAAYFAAYESARGGPPPFNGTGGKAVKDLLAACGGDAERAIACVRNAYADTFWQGKVSICDIARDPGKFATAPTSGRNRLSAPLQSGGWVDNSIDAETLVNND